MIGSIHFSSIYLVYSVLLNGYGGDLSPLAPRSLIFCPTRNVRLWMVPSAVTSLTGTYWTVYTSKPGMNSRGILCGRATPLHYHIKYKYLKLSGRTSENNH